MEDVCAEVIERSKELRTNKKATRMQKRNALTYLMRALSKAGVSHHKAAVPVSQRSLMAWYGSLPS